MPQIFAQGIALHRQGHVQAALDQYLKALRLQPQNPQILLAIGAALHDLQQYEDALAVYQRIVGQSAPEAPLWHNQGNTLLALGRYQEAVDSYARAVALRPDDAEALVTMGTALEQLGDYPGAFAAYDEALRRQPDCVEAHCNMALALLRQGDYLRGWREYEWRKGRRAIPEQSRVYRQPTWDGAPLKGATLLVHAEQGFGDAIQFIRYLPLVVAMGGEVIFECHAQLVPLFTSLAASVAVFPFGSNLPRYDFHLPMFSLPRIFETTLESIPREVPYLKADVEKCRVWSRRLVGEERLKVGVVWAGSRQHHNDRTRSMRLADLKPLFTLTGVAWFSLQVGPAQVEAMAFNDVLVDVAGELNDFADTAALIEQLDLVISVDTAVAHLAGALGKPVWLLVPFVPDWRWLLGRTDSPWYPTMRLFRQLVVGSWAEPVGGIAHALSQCRTNGR